MKLYEYYNENSAIHKMNPIVKLAWLAVLTSVVFMVSDAKKLSLIFLSIMLIALFAKIPFKYLFQYSKVMLSFLVAAYLILFLITRGSVVEGLLFMIKITIILLSTLLFVLTTSKRDMMISLIKLKIPSSFSFTLTIAIQFLPLVIKDFEEVIRAQKTRHHRLLLNPLRPFNSARSYYPVVIPSFILLFKRAFDLSLSAEARGFTPQIYKRKKMRFAFTDIFSSAILAALVMCILFL